MILWLGYPNLSVCIYLALQKFVVYITFASTSVIESIFSAARETGRSIEFVVLRLRIVLETVLTYLESEYSLSDLKLRP